MTTWNWECLVAGCDGAGTGPDQDSVVEDAHAHNAEMEHSQPMMSYGNDDPVEP